MKIFSNCFPLSGFVLRREFFEEVCWGGEVRLEPEAHQFLKR